MFKNSLEEFLVTENRIFDFSVKFEFEQKSDQCNHFVARLYLGLYCFFKMELELSHFLFFSKDYFFMRFADLDIMDLFTDLYI